jgi:sugar phosphate isomerase/epimerase
MLAASALLLARSATAQPPAERQLKVSIFSKHLQFLEGDELARAAAEIGFDGVDLTVRRGGHVEPERVAEDLPPLVALLRKHGLAAQMVTSGIVDAESPHAEAVLKTLAGLGIRYYRWGGFRYQREGPLLPQLEALKPRIEKLAALNARYKLCAMYHTHSGVGQVGASIWDMHLLLKDFDPEAVAVNYDVGHATIEGGFGDWINSFRITGPHLKGIAVKDFVWAKGERGWNVQWCPLGEGMVRFPQFCELVKQSGFDGPLQVHYEYPLGGAETGKKTLTISREQALSAMKRDLTRLRGWLQAAGLT